MKAQHNKILTLVNIEEPIQTIIESTVNLAKAFQAEVKFLYVKKPMDPMRTENQLAVIRTMAEEQKVIEKFKKALQRIQELNQLKLNFEVTDGLVKKTIQREIGSYDPDLIVLGKRRPNVYRIIGKQVTEFVLKNFKGPVLIAHPSEVLEIKDNLSLGVLNDIKTIEENDVTNALIRQSKKPIKLFAIADNSDPLDSTAGRSAETVNYRFENNPDALKNMTRYVHKNNVHLLFLDRTKKEQSNQKVKIKDVLKHIDTSMLMVGSN